MWDDRILFVASALLSLVLTVAFNFQRNASPSRIQIKWANSVPTLVAIIYALLLIVHLGLNRHDLSLPSAGSALALLIGAVFGAFSARFIWSFFGPSFGRRDPLIGACVLLILAFSYSLPLYHRELAALLNDAGLASLKTPFVELTFASDSASKGRQGSISAAGAQTGSQPQSVPRLSDPTPGLTWLHQDVGDEPGNTLAADLDYIEFLEPGPRFPGLQKFPRGHVHADPEFFGTRTSFIRLPGQIC
jgi:hypothetical protein